MKATTRLFMLFPPYLPLQAYISIVRITLAGLPTTTALSGTSLVTTLAGGPNDRVFTNRHPR